MHAGYPATERRRPLGIASTHLMRARIKKLGFDTPLELRYATKPEVLA